MLKLLIGAACVVTFCTMFWLTADHMRSDDSGNGRGALYLDVGVTLAVGYGLFALADRLDLVYKPSQSRHLLDEDDKDD